MLKIAHCTTYSLPLPVGHRFPMLKYELIPEQLIYEGTCRSDNFFCPGLLDERWILGVHTAGYWENLKTLKVSPKMIRRIGFPLSEALVRREITIARGTMECCHFAMTDGISLNVAGGTHHAYPDKGEGFCLLNDVGIGAHYLLVTGKARRILLIDLDVHQGNGSAVMFQNEPRVFTFSMHGRDNYPLHKEVSDLDIPLETGTSDEEYLNLLYKTLPTLFAKHQPDFAFFVAGVDILATDKLGHLAVSRNGCRNRDQFVFETCQRAGVPLVVAMGGGYSPRIPDIVEAHCNTFRLAQMMYFE
jgi:acetoin utilization deacetylase AcuC-like enzyme